ncbi:MAG: FABP family protein [Pseudomonadales bacterium]|nr:FABP family protein [Pseudomonadales bacterium]
MSDVDFGPLQHLIGVWKGDKGIDIAPIPGSSEDTPYFETISIVAVGDVTNAKKQTLVVVKYHQVVSNKSDGAVFHDQIGYWTFDPETGVLTQSVNIPRAVGLLAGGNVSDKNGRVEFSVKAIDGDKDWGVVQSPFMRDNARTVSFEHKVVVEGNVMTYEETTVLDIYGKTFDHTDQNTLIRS